jgi:hypothetical protein
MLITTGMNKATTPVELMNADNTATAGISSSNRRASLALARPAIFTPIQAHLARHHAAA